MVLVNTRYTYFITGAKYDEAVLDKARLLLLLLLSSLPLGVTYGMGIIVFFCLALMSSGRGEDVFLFGRGGNEHAKTPDRQPDGLETATRRFSNVHVAL